MAGYLRARYPELEPSLQSAINAFDAIKQYKRINDDLLAPILAAASSSRVPLYENAATFMQTLTGQFALACDAVLGMAEDSKSHIRFNAILCLGKLTPRSLTRHVLRQGLRDKSSRVRTKAADWTGRLRTRELVPDLEEAMVRETHEGTKETIDFNLRLLRDGYILKETPDDRFSVTTFMQNGIVSRTVSRTELDQRGVETIAAELRSSR